MNYLTIIARHKIKVSTIPFSYRIAPKKTSATVRNELIQLAGLTLKSYLISPLAVLESMLSMSFYICIDDK